MAAWHFHFERNRRRRRRLDAEIYLVRAGGFGIGLAPLRKLPAEPQRDVLTSVAGPGTRGLWT